jgi:hypothetical protein
MKDHLLVLGIITGFIVMLPATLAEPVLFNDMIWISSGVGIILASFGLYRFSSQRGKIETDRQEEKRLKKLIKHGVKVVVDLNKCEMRASSYHIEGKGYDYLDEMEGLFIILDSGKNEKQTTVTQTVLIYHHKMDNGKTITFYGPTEKDKRTLEIRCAMQGTTTIHFDKNDPGIYYFNLSFLE